MFGVGLIGSVDLIPEKLVKGSEVLSNFVGSMGGDVLQGQGELGVVAFVGIEGGDSGGGVGRVVVEILLQHLVHLFYLSVGLQVIGGGEGSAVGDDVIWESMLGEYMFKKQFGKLWSIVSGVAGDEEGLLVLQVVVVGVYLDAVQGPLEVGLPLTEGFNDCKEFFVIDVVVEFHWDHQSGVEGDGMEIFAPQVQLGEYSGDSVVGGIALEHDWPGGVKMAENRSGGEGPLQEEEYALALAVPIPRGVLLRESVEGFGDPRVVVNEMAIKVSKPQE
ncbi:hypothetical protein C0989_001079 [Termitomyces sp. Mn162]|nr:hypothetical protein C0989_001079 [Termitomyces sp. Mn162]